MHLKIWGRVIKCISRKGQQNENAKSAKLDGHRHQPWIALKSHPPGVKLGKWKDFKPGFKPFS